MILALTWRLVIHFVAQLEPKHQSCESLPSTPSNELLRWMRANTEPWYRGVVVDGWTARLADGRAFCHLLHRYDFEALDIDNLPDEGSGGQGVERTTLQRAFDVGMARFEAPRLIDAADLSASTAPPGELPYDIRSMQLYVMKLREALRKHTTNRRAKVDEACEAVRTEALALKVWSQKQTDKLEVDTTTVRGFSRRNQPDVFQADRMLNVFEDKFRRRHKPKHNARRTALTEEQLPNTRARVVASATADSRIIDALPEGKDAWELSASIGKTVDAKRAAVDSELVACVAAMEEAWHSMEMAEQAYSDALWAILVEKRTDLMVHASVSECDELCRLMRYW